MWTGAYILLPCFLELVFQLSSLVSEQNYSHRLNYYLLESHQEVVTSMCHTEDVFHKACHHWGRERFVGGPCCRSRLVNGRHTGCGYIEKIGSVNSNDLCFDCKFRQARGGEWRPFANVSNDGWARVEEKIRQRSLTSDDLYYVQNGKPIVRSV